MRTADANGRCIGDTRHYQKFGARDADSLQVERYRVRSNFGCSAMVRACLTPWLVGQAGKIPASIGGLVQLQELSLWGNSLTGNCAFSLHSAQS